MATEQQQQQKPKPQDAQASLNKPSFALTMLDRYVSSFGSPFPVARIAGTSPGSRTGRRGVLKAGALDDCNA